MKKRINVEITDVVAYEEDPLILAKVKEVGTGRVIYSTEISNVFRLLAANHLVYKCINLGKDRFGLPCVIDT